MIGAIMSNLNRHDFEDALYYGFNENSDDDIVYHLGGWIFSLKGDVQDIVAYVNDELGDGALTEEGLRAAFVEHQTYDERYTKDGQVYITPADFDEIVEYFVG